MDRHGGMQVPKQGLDRDGSGNADAGQAVLQVVPPLQPQSGKKGRNGDDQA